jgi:poly-gamma-glutamate synthesis protein (capsule biosynthesis protein)
MDAIKRAAALLYAGLAAVCLWSETSRPLLLSFVGDIMAHNVNYRMTDYSLIYRGVAKILTKDDVTFGNLEFPVDPARPQSTWPRFNAHPEYVAAAVRGGVDAFSLANNHLNDQGHTGFLQTLKSLARLEQALGRRIYFSGTRESMEKGFRPTRIRIKGWDIGFLAVAQFENIPSRPSHVLVVDYRKEEEASRFLQWLEGVCREYDLFILSYHGGVEYASTPDAGKQRFFHSLIDKGVHVVYAHHPHVLQPVELLERKGQRRAILYSTGNFISGQGWIINPSRPESRWANTGDSAIFQLRVEDTASGPSVEAIRPIPVANYRTPARDVVIEPLDSLARRLLDGPWSAFYKERKRIMQRYVEAYTLHKPAIEELVP